MYDNFSNPDIQGLLYIDEFPKSLARVCSTAPEKNRFDMHATCSMTSVCVQPVILNSTLIIANQPNNQPLYINKQTTLNFPELSISPPICCLFT